MPRLLPALLAALALCSDSSSRRPGQGASLALTDVTVIDATGAAPMPRMTVLVQGSRIAAVFPTGSRELPGGTEVLPLAGHYVMPGLIDAHAHLATFDRGDVYPALLRGMLHGGVTSMRDMGGNTRRVSDLARSAREGVLESPRLFYSAVVAGPEWFATYDPERVRFWSDAHAPGSAPGVRTLSAARDVESIVEEAAGLGATGIKVYSDVAPDLLRALVDAAHRRGLKVWAHAVVPPSRPEEVVVAGVDAVSHSDQLIWAAAAPGDTLASRAGRQRLIRSVVPADSPPMIALFREMKARGTLFEPTLLVMALGSARAEAERAPLDSIIGWSVAATRAAYRAGVPIVAGTDAIGTYTPNLHSELQLLVERAGMTPLDAIRAATHNAALALGAQDSLGTVTPGKLADLVILRADPSTDVRNTQTVAYVVHGGRLIRRQGEWRAPQLGRLPE